jgi:hypothetical protein
MRQITFEKEYQSRPKSSMDPPMRVVAAAIFDAPMIDAQHYNKID